MLGDYVTSVLRTVVPTAWGALIAWLVGQSLLPPALEAQAASFGVVVVAVAIGAYYALVRWLETQTWFPVWLSTVLLGGSKPPEYRPSA